MQSICASLVPSSRSITSIESIDDSNIKVLKSYDACRVVVPRSAGPAVPITSENPIASAMEAMEANDI